MFPLARYTPVNLGNLMRAQSLAPLQIAVKLGISSLIVGSCLGLQNSTLAAVITETTKTTEAILRSNAEANAKISSPETTIAETPNITTPITTTPSPILPPSPQPSWQDSPVLQRWQQQIPNVLMDIENDPSFRTRWRLGYGESNQQGRVNLGVEDIFLGDRLTLSGDYQSGNHPSYGAELRYYLLPLGNYVNAAPVLGYRQINSQDLTASGVTVGGRVQVVLSRPSAADIALTQTWVAPGSRQEIAITNLALGYAITRHVRVGTQWQLESRGGKSDRRWGIFVELY